MRSPASAAASSKTPPHLQGLFYEAALPLAWQPTLRARRAIEGSEDFTAGPCQVINARAIESWQLRMDVRYP